MIDSCYLGDVRDGLRAMIAAGVRARTCVTSPPYWGLRDYGVAGQLGIEPTPGEFLDVLVDVFRLVRDVLADDGTLWLNLGDSYAGSRCGGETGNSTLEGARQSQDQAKTAKRAMTASRRRDDEPIPRSDVRVAGLKPKDLCMMPARLAIALQEPYYTGRIRDERDRIWLAAMIDAEGCIFIHRRKAGQNNWQGYVRQNDNFAPGLEVSNTSRAIVERCAAITGIGSICSQGPDETGGKRKQTLYRWNVRTIECADLLREVYPYLIAKQHQARLAFGCPPSGDHAAAAHAALMDLHRGRTVTVDFNAPRSMFEQGWFLRQDIVWKKPNPMPESVTDRCTKAHEYLFLLSKRERYYFDAQAIREQATSDARDYKTPDGWDTSSGAGGHGSFHRDGREAGHTGYERKPVADRGAPAGGGNQAGSVPWEGDSRNKRSVWTIPTEPFPEAHFATFPTALVEPCVLAGSAIGDVVLDPFMGSGTVAQVAQALGRSWVGCELNPEYHAMIARRTRARGLALA